jgi:hypothetical protein
VKYQLPTRSLKPLRRYNLEWLYGRALLTYRHAQMPPMQILESTAERVWMNDAVRPSISKGLSPDVTCHQQSDNSLSGRAFGLAACILAVALVTPIWLVDLPPLIDYPNHLARAYLLEHIHNDPWLSRIFSVHWGILPNLAVDLIWPPLVGILPPLVAGQFVLATTLLAPLCGVLVFNRALFGRASRWSLACALVAFNTAFLIGLLNFLLGLAGAFCVAAVWVRWQRRRSLSGFLVVSIGAILLFFCHIMAVAFLAVLIISYEGENILSSEGGRHIVRRGMAIGMIFVPVIVLYCISPTAQATGPMTWPLPISKLFYTFAPVMNYNLGNDIAVAGVLLGFLAVALNKRWLLMPRSTCIGLSTLVILYIITPSV